MRWKSIVNSRARDYRLPTKNYRLVYYAVTVATGWTGPRARSLPRAGGQESLNGSFESGSVYAVTGATGWTGPQALAARAAAERV